MPDSDEILLGHLLRRVQDLHSELDKQENEVLKHDKRCLQEQIAALEGHPIRSPRQDPMDAVRERHESLNKALDLMIQDALDSEAVIEVHNRKHPELPWADVKQDLIQFCGDCTKARAIRDAQLREEAKK
jgi:hypothetical protein